MASFLLVAVALGAGLRSRPQSLVGIEPVSPVTPSVTATTVSPSPTAEESPTPTPDRTTPETKPAPHVSRSPVPAPQPTPVPGPSMPAGWSCAPASEIPPEGGAPADGVTLSLEAPAVVDADKPGEATLVLTNGTDEGAYVRFFPQNRPGDISGPFQTVMTNGAGTFSGILSDGVGREARDLLTTGGGEIGAGESYRMPVRIMTWGCDADGGRVPPGTYRMSVGVEIDDGGGFGSPTASPSPAYSPPPRPSRWDRTWATAAVTITVR
ncbi:MAG TPA: hypothetical protein VNQ77_06140 [Frankiaceae bacterium]|nr:hypothetical protein [Frankiaceae bacterium]